MVAVYKPWCNTVYLLSKRPWAIGRGERLRGGKCVCDYTEMGDYSGASALAMGRLYWDMHVYCSLIARVVQVF